MHFLSHVNLFTKGMDVLNDDRLIRLQYIGLFATNHVKHILRQLKHTAYQSP